jgi:hypothetical protein
MKLTRPAMIGALAVGALAVGVPLAANAASSTSSPNVASHQGHKTSAGQAPTVAVYDCADQPQVKPTDFDIFCDGSGYFVHLDWTAWNTTLATATAVQYQDNCEPDCVAGKWSHQPVDVILWRSEPVKGHPGEYGFSRITELYPNSANLNDSYTDSPPGAFPGEH